MLWRCQLGDRKGIRPVKNWVVGCWHDYLPGAGMIICLEWGATCILPSWCHCHLLSLVSVKSRLVYLSGYRLTKVVPDKGPLNVRLCVCVYCNKLFSYPSQISVPSLSAYFSLWEYMFRCADGVVLELQVGCSSEPGQVSDMWCLTDDRPRCAAAEAAWRSSLSCLRRL